MKYFFRKSVEGAEAQEITRDEACRLLENTYGPINNRLTQMENGNGNNASTFDGQVFIQA